MMTKFGNETAKVRKDVLIFNFIVLTKFEKSKLVK